MAQPPVRHLLGRPLREPVAGEVVAVQRHAVRLEGGERAGVEQRDVAVRLLEVAVLYHQRVGHPPDGASAEHLGPAELGAVGREVARPAVEGGAAAPDGVEREVVGQPDRRVVIGEVARQRATETVRAIVRLVGVAIAQLRQQRAHPVRGGQVGFAPHLGEARGRLRHHIDRGRADDVDYRARRGRAARIVESPARRHLRAHDEDVVGVGIDQGIERERVGIVGAGHAGMADGDQQQRGQLQPHPPPPPPKPPTAPSRVPSRCWCSAASSGSPSGAISGRARSSR